MYERENLNRRAHASTGFVAPTLVWALRQFDRLSVANLVGHRLAISWTTFVDLYVLGWASALAVALFLLPPLGLVAALGAYRLMDILAVNLRIILVDRKNPTWEPASAERTVTLLLINFWEIGVAFALLYRAWGSVVSTAGNELEPLAALYYSFTTLSTLGYGDIAPADARTQGLVIAQLLTSVTFLIAILPTLISAVQKSSRGKDEGAG